MDFDYFLELLLDIGGSIFFSGVEDLVSVKSEERVLLFVFVADIETAEP